MKKMLQTGLLALLAVLSAQAEEMFFGYHGKLLNADGTVSSHSVPMTMAFKIYLPNGITPLWGRLLPVKINTGGTFYAELSDATGTEVSGALFPKLADAVIAAGNKTIYLGLTPEGTTEISPRFELSAPLFAQYAQKVSTVDRICGANAVITNAVTVSGTLNVGTLSTVTFAQTPTANLSYQVPANGTTLKLTVGSTFNLSRCACLMGARGDISSVPSSAPTDLMVLWKNASTHQNSYFTLIYPLGNSISKSGAADFKVYPFGTGGLY